MIPSYLSNNFFQALGNLVNERNIQKKTFTNYTELQEKGIADTVPASIPTEYGSFAEFIDNKSNLSPFEGIWEDSTDGAYVLGQSTVIRVTQEVHIRLSLSRAKDHCGRVVK